MSDFDKEAEREKLRKKYERDKRDREATQRMSDLLLKGATMTNTHCDTCADPLFRQNGVTFCPSCHGGPEAVEGPDLEESDDEVAESAAEEESAAETADKGEAEAEDATAAESRAEPEPATPTADEEKATEPPASASEEERTDSSRTADASVVRHTTPPRRTPPSQQSSGRREERVDRGRRTRERTGRRSSPPVDADLETARASLTEALERFSREAAETDDPRYARDCLEAAREAAEALAVLGR
ncbi:Sjogren's syndrome/scleroderma autoantigen 1 family protein [Natronobeatus ordinarius]|uniref:Sjogren's syndrome/scleroderma autoantigen 1 family protein n=1 Tax=Natronobeatus ordinarius TaxID=2963433 RepID=UPI0020CD3DD5|nr:Sjogren's syndrome/scleroderma autoantigen 1 family protein [Natronobeatus ordinarius]